VVLLATKESIVSSSNFSGLSGYRIRYKIISPLTSSVRYWKKAFYVQEK